MKSNQYLIPGNGANFDVCKIAAGITPKLRVIVFSTGIKIYWCFSFLEAWQNEKVVRCSQITAGLFPSRELFPREVFCFKGFLASRGFLAREASGDGDSKGEAKEECFSDSKVGAKKEFMQHHKK